MQWLSPSPVCHSPSLHVLVWTSFWTGVVVFCSLVFFSVCLIHCFTRVIFSANNTFYHTWAIVFNFSFFISSYKERRKKNLCVVLFDVFLFHFFLTKKKKKNVWYCLKSRELIGRLYKKNHAWHWDLILNLKRLQYNSFFLTFILGLSNYLLPL